MEKTTAALEENYGNQNPHLIQQIWKPGNGRCVITCSGLGSGWTVLRIIKGMIIINNSYHVETEQSGLTFQENSINGRAGALLLKVCHTRVQLWNLSLA